MNTRMITGLFMSLLSLMVAGCSHYYRVTDPGSGKTYYTTDIDEMSGGVRFKDDRTKSKVTLHSSEVSEISEAEYGAEVQVRPPVTLGPSAKTEPREGAR